MMGGSTSARRIGAREAAVAVGRPLHRRAHAVAVAEMDVVAHADLVAVIDHRRAGHREQQAVHQLDAAAVALEQRREPAADAEIDARAPVGGVGLPEIVALADRSPSRASARRGCAGRSPTGSSSGICGVWRMMSVIGKRSSRAMRHVHARHQREVERHVAFVAVAEIVLGVLRPLVGLGQQHAAGIVRVELGADRLQDVVRLGQVLVVGALALDQVGHGVEPQPVDARGRARSASRPALPSAPRGLSKLRSGWCE